MIGNFMLERADKQNPPAHFGAKLLIVRGRRFSNSAAKFWTSLMDELLAEHADCPGAALEAVNAGKLDAALLFPEIELERDLNLLSDNIDNFGEVWQKALADFELYGPPGSVALRIFSPAGERRRVALPMDCVDAELFPYLLVWLLEWADVPLSAWNEPSVKGAFTATDPLRKYKYDVRFVIEHQPLKEGLFVWKVELGFERER